VQEARPTKLKNARGLKTPRAHLAKGGRKGEMTFGGMSSFRLDINKKHPFGSIRLVFAIAIWNDHESLGEVKRI
jgi:hypothetical protein